jgi:hypothetical protein
MHGLKPFCNINRRTWAQTWYKRGIGVGLKLDGQATKGVESWNAFHWEERHLNFLRGIVDQERYRSSSSGGAKVEGDACCFPVCLRRLPYSLGVTLAARKTGGWEGVAGDSLTASVKVQALVARISANL